MISHYFDHPDIHREYLRWRNKINGDAAATIGDDIALSVGEVLRAHFLIAEFFADEDNGIGGIGPRDTNAHLLHSAVSRQFVAFGGVQKWTDNFQIAATALFGLIKNEPFHDGNKRTALLSVLHLLEKQGYTAAGDKRRFENFVVGISEDRYRRESLYRYFCNKDILPDDAAIYYIAHELKDMTRKFDRSHRTLTYRQLNGLLKSHGFELKNPHNNNINIVRMKDDKVIGHVGFPGMSKQIAKGDLRKVRKICQLSEADGFDSKAFFNGTENMDYLLSEYAAPLRRLANR